MALTPDPFDTAPSNPWELVLQGITNNQDKADEAYQDSEVLLNKLGNLANTLNTIEAIQAITLGDIQSTVSPYVSPTPPVEPDMTTHFPSAPDEPVTGTVGAIELGAVPVFTATEPTLNTIATPAPFTRAAPTEPTLDTPVLPVEPSDALPAAPSQRDIVLPDAPNVITFEFDGVMPGALAAPPSTEFAWSNEDYTSLLNTELKGELLDLVRNVRQTGLSDKVRQELRDKARERISAIASQRRASARRQFAALSWNMPQGDEALLLMKAEEDAITDTITQYRSEDEIDAKLEQSNFQFAFGQSIAFEGQLINLHNSEQQRKFEAAKYAIEAAVSLFGLQVQYYNAGVTMYEAQARVYAERLRAQLTQVEVYKAQLEGQKLIGDLNRQDVELYKAQIDAVLSTFELYKSKLEGVKTLMQADELKLKRFEATVRAFAEEVRAKSLENDSYKTQVDAEKLKADMYGTLASAFRSRIEGFKIETDAKVAKQESDIKVAYDVPLKVAEMNTDRYKAMIQAESEKLGALAKLFETRGNVFESQVKGETGRTEAEVKIQQNEVERLKADAEVRLETMKANISTLLAQKEMIIGIAKTVAQVQAQLAASFGSAVNYGASTAFNQSQSRTFSYQYSDLNLG